MINGSSSKLIMSSNLTISISTSFRANDEMCLVSMSFKICSRLLFLSDGKFWVLIIEKFRSGSKVGLTSLYAKYIDSFVVLINL